MLIILLVKIEQVVVGWGPSFVLLYGLYRLVPHWCCFRFDDTIGIRPSLLRPHARGLSGVLDRSKTSGAGKSLQKMPFLILYPSYICEPTWLETGLELLRTEYGFTRDYLLPLPNATFTAPPRHRAVYNDVVGFSKKLLGQLTTDQCDGEHLLIDEALTFWSEHSDRCGLDTWCAAIGHGSSHRDFLGKRGAHGSSDKYVRTSFRIVEALQFGGLSGPALVCRRAGLFR